jgi:hypothetical protein
MNEAELEQAAKKIVNICLGLPTPDDACTVLATAIQLVSCMATESRNGALQRNAKFLLEIQKQLALNYDAYMHALTQAGKETGVVIWLDGEPPKNKSDKTKH